MRDLAVLMSHLTAIHNSIFFKNGNNPATNTGEVNLTDFALILEDDIRFLYNIDFYQLISTAPRPFGVLQLSTSNVEAIKNLWSKFKRHKASNSSQARNAVQESLWQRNRWNDLTRNKRYPLYWSAQAYIVNRTHLRNAINDIVERNPLNGSLSFRIINSFFPQSCKRTKSRFDTEYILFFLLITNY